jgi:hypothetical protein
MALGPKRSSRPGWYVVLAATLVVGASLADAATTTTIRISAPATVKVNKPYRVTVSGTVDKVDLLDVFVRTKGKCRRTAYREAMAGSYVLVRGQFVDRPKYKVRSDKTVFTKRHRHARICVYLPRNHKRASKRIQSTR